MPSQIARRPALPLAAPQPDDRSTGILVAVRATFAEKGFDGASMQDLARAAGISVGNFYRYFPSKVAIIEALVQHDLIGIEALLDQIAAAPDPLAALRVALDAQMEQSSESDTRLWAEISAAALRPDGPGSCCALMEERIAAGILRIFARAAGLDMAGAEQRLGSHARYVVLMVRAAKCRGGEPHDPVLKGLILRGLDLVIEEISTLASSD